MARGALVVCTFLVFCISFGTADVLRQQAKKTMVKQEALCDMTAAEGICLFGGKKIIVPDATPKASVARYDFNDAWSLDTSGSQNHMSTSVPSRPGRGSSNMAASFNGDFWAEVPASDSLSEVDAGDFTASFWVFLDMSVGSFDPDAPTCPMLAKGAGEEKQTSGVFSIEYEASTGTVIASRGFGGSKVEVKSTGRLLAQQWTYIALTSEKDAGGYTLSIYINGVFDGAAAVNQGYSAPNEPTNLYLAAVPWQGECVLPLLLDDVHVYSRALSTFELRAESFPALGATNPDFVLVACDDDAPCAYSKAKPLCQEFGDGDYELCTSRQIDTGAYQFARMMGWLTWSSKVWALDVAPVDLTPRVALCCRE